KTSYILYVMSERASRNGNEFRQLRVRYVEMGLLPLEHRGELLPRNGRHGGGIARAEEPDVRVHVVEEAHAMTRHPMEALDRVVLEIAVEQRIRIEPERGIGPRFLTFQRGLLREFHGVRIRRDQHDLVRFRSKASLHDAFRQRLRTNQ